MEILLQNKQKRVLCIKELLFHQEEGKLYEYDPNSKELKQNFEEYMKKTYPEQYVTIYDEELHENNTNPLSPSFTINNNNIINSIHTININQNEILSLSSSSSSNLNLSSSFYIPDYDILEKAKKDASVLEKVAELQRNLTWSLDILPRINEPDCGKSHWDFLLSEMAQVSSNFRKNRKKRYLQNVKMGKLCKSRVNLELLKEEKKEKLEKLQVKKIASQIAKQIKGFWAQVDKLVKKNLEFKKEEKLQEEREKQLEIFGWTNRKIFDNVSERFKNSS